MPEILIPFGLDIHGNVATTSDPNTMQMQHVESIIKTYPGERVMQPKYGIPLVDYVFGTGPDFTSQEIQKDVITQIAMWEPSIQVISIDPVLDDETQGVVTLNVNFNGPGGNTAGTGTGIATSYVGGTVVES